MKRTKIKEAYRLAKSQENTANESRAVMYDDLGAYWCRESSIKTFMEMNDAKLVCIISSKGEILK